MTRSNFNNFSSLLICVITFSGFRLRPALLNLTQHFTHNFGVAGHHLSEFEIIIVTLVVGGNATGFAHDESTSRDIPGIESGFPESVEPTCGDVGEIERCRSGATHVGRSGEKFAKNFQKFIKLIMILEREASAEQGAPGRSDTTDANAFIV